MIQLTSKRVFYRGVFIFIGALIGGLISKVNSYKSRTFETLLVQLHFVFLFSSILRLEFGLSFLEGLMDQFKIIWFFDFEDYFLLFFSANSTSLEFYKLFF